MDETLDLAVALAMREAAQCALMPLFRTGQSIGAVYKSPGELVTEADRKCEEILAEKLHRLHPDAAIVGEEASHDQPDLARKLESGMCWIIDPLDGTANFAAGHGPFGIMVALAYDGCPVAGWIFDPLSGRFCSGQQGKGARIDGQPFTSKSGLNKPLKVAMTRLFPDISERNALAATVSGQFQVQDSPRCAADQYPRVATGEADVTLFTRTFAWDHAAGVAFLNAAGGKAARPDGSPFRCNDPRGGLIVANCPENWEKVHGALEEAGFDLSHTASMVPA